MPNDTVQPQAEPLEAPPRESVKLSLREPPEPDEIASPADETFGGSIYRVRMSDEERQSLTTYLEKTLTDIKTARENGGWDADWDLWEDMYFNVSPDTASGRSALFVPITQEACDTIDAVIEQAVFGPRPWLGLLPREPSDLQSIQRKEQFCQYGLEVDMHAKDRLDPVRWEAIVLGTGVVFLPWLRELDRIQDEETYDGTNPQDVARFLERYPDAEKDYAEIYGKLRNGEKVYLTVEYSEAVHDAPDVVYVPLRDWLVFPTAKWDQLHREPFVGHRMGSVTWDMLVGLEEEEYYDEGTTDKVRFLYQQDSPDPKFNELYETKDYEIITGVLRWKRPNETRERRYLVDYHRESRTIMRLLRFPYWHNKVNYIPWYLQRSRKYIYGISMPQKLEPAQTWVNGSNSLLLDGVSFAALPMFKARTGTELTFNPLRDGLYAGKVFYFQNPQTDAEAFQMSGSSALPLLLQSMAMGQRHAELSVGATQGLSGLENPRDPGAPATKTIYETTQSLKRIGRYLGTFGASLVELGFQAMELYYQFAPKGKVFRVMGAGDPVFERITRQELRLRADFYPHGSTAALNPDQTKKETFEVTELILKQFPEVGAVPESKRALLEFLLDSMGPEWAVKKQKLLPPITAFQPPPAATPGLAGGAGSPGSPGNGVASSRIAQVLAAAGGAPNAQ